MQAQKQERKCRVRRRNTNEGSVSRPMAMRVRMTRGVSSKVASIQGLIWRYGKRETMAELFESVCLPALAEYVKPYAEQAKLSRSGRVQGGAR